MIICWTTGQYHRAEGSHGLRTARHEQRSVQHRGAGAGDVRSDQRVWPVHQAQPKQLDVAAASQRKFSHTARQWKNKTCVCLYSHSEKYWMCHTVEFLKGTKGVEKICMTGVCNRGAKLLCSFEGVLGYAHGNTARFGLRVLVNTKKKHTWYIHENRDAFATNFRTEKKAKHISCFCSCWKSKMQHLLFVGTQGVRAGESLGEGYGYGSHPAGYPDERGVPAQAVPTTQRHLLQHHAGQTVLLRQKLLHHGGIRLCTVSFQFIYFVSPSLSWSNRNPDVIGHHWSFGGWIWWKHFKWYILSLHAGDDKKARNRHRWSPILSFGSVICLLVWQ